MYEWVLLVVVLILVVYFWRVLAESFTLPNVRSAGAMRRAYAIALRDMPAGATPEQAHARVVEIRDAWRSIVDMYKMNIDVLTAANRGSPDALRRELKEARDNIIEIQRDRLPPLNAIINAYKARGPLPTLSPGCWKTPSSDSIYYVNAQGGVCHIGGERQYKTRCGQLWNAHKTTTVIPGAAGARSC